MPNNNPFSTVARKYIDKGYSIIPVIFAEKRPAIKNWTKFSQNYASSEQLELWCAQKYNIGVCMGKLSNIVGIDLDNDIDDIHQKICSLLPETPIIKRGAKGFTKFYQYNGETSKTLKYKGQQIGDLLSDNRQCVLPPSVHPNKEPYVWDKFALCDIKSVDLPKIPTETWNQINELLCPMQYKNTQYKEPTKDDIESALSCINPDESYDVWLQIGMALHDYSNGAQWGAELFEKWSMRGNKYNAGEPVQKWDSFKSNNNGITIKTLFYIAKNNGYHNQNIQSVSDSEMQQILRDFVKKQQEQVRYTEKLENMQQKMLDAPGLIKQVSEYIKEVSYKEQPILALSGAIVAVGTIFAQRAQTRTGLRSNIYCFSIGETGCGKDDPRKAIKILFKYLPPDIRDSLSGCPASTAGLMSALEKTKGKTLFLIDEIGHYISAINGKASQAYSKEIIPMLTQLYSSANTTFTGFEYSQRSKDSKPRVDIEQPCVCVLGSSVPSRVYGAIKKDDILDGFMTRWIIMETTDIDPKDNKNMKSFELSSGIALIETIKKIVQALDKKNTFSDVIPIPHTVLPTSRAVELLEYYKQLFNEQRVLETKKESDIRYLYSRAYENLEKLSIIGAEIDTKTCLPIITESSVVWAYYVVLYSIERMKMLLNNIEKTENEQKLEIMENKIKQACSEGKISLSKFGDVCRCFKKRERNELLDDLIETGRINRTTCNNITYIEPVKL